MESFEEVMKPSQEAAQADTAEAEAAGADGPDPREMVRKYINGRK